MYDVALTQSAARVYRKLKARARAAEERGDTADSAPKTFAIVDDLIRHTILASPHDSQRALHAPLTGLFRLERSNVRVIYWAPAIKRRPVCVVSISTKLRRRSRGQDPYARLIRMRDSGYFRKIIEQMQRAIPK
jgi:mRNA-degrading endonuclease RelE of RelBE toxin-antitoxin system